jgi:hypothetical protein
VSPSSPRQTSSAPNSPRTSRGTIRPLTVDGERASITGIGDPVHVLPGQAEVIDFKTDGTRHAEAEYRKQVSVY